jgi:hypothetical protein
METAVENRDLWEEIVPRMHYYQRIEDLPADRFLMPRDTVLKLRELTLDLTGEDDPDFLAHLVIRSKHRSHRYVTARINSLCAFRSLAPELYFDSPLTELNAAISGLAPRCDRDHAYDYSEPERYQQALPLMETVMGILRFHSYLMQPKFFDMLPGGEVSLKKDIAELVTKYPDKASQIPTMLYERNYQSYELFKIEELLATESASLLEGTL